MHVLEYEPCRRQRVDVPPERTVHEPDTNSWLDLFDIDRFGEVLTDPPVLLGWVKDLIVDPPAVRSLEKGVVQQEKECSARGNDSRHLANCRVEVVDVLEDQTRNDGVEVVVIKGQPVNRGDLISNAAAARASNLDVALCRIDPNHFAIGSSGRKPTTHLTLTASDVEYPRCL